MMIKVNIPGFWDILEKHDEMTCVQSVYTACLASTRGMN